MTWVMITLFVSELLNDEIVALACETLSECSCNALHAAQERVYAKLIVWFVCTQASAFLTECNKRLDAAARPANSANPSRAASAPADVSQPPQTAATSAVGRTTVIRKYVGTAPAGGSPPSTGWGTSNPAGGGSAASAVASPGAGGLRAADLKQAQAGALATAAHIQLLMADLASAGHVSTEELDEAAVRAVAMAGNTSSSSAMDPEISAARELLLDPSARLKSAHKCACLRCQHGFQEALFETLPFQRTRSHRNFTSS